MAGAFRDDDLAARQRADALEQRVEALEAEKRALTEQLAQKPHTPSPRKALPIALLPLLLGGSSCWPPEPPLAACRCASWRAAWCCSRPCSAR